MKIDIVILSYAKTDKHYQLTANCLNSLLNSKGSENFKIIVVESQKGVFYNQFYCVSTIHLDKPFNYNGFANVGISEYKNELIGVFNNDVIFDENWFEEILKHYQSQDLFSCSPISHTSQSQRQWFRTTEPVVGYGIAKELSGWAIVFTRKLWDKLGGLDDCCTFWCSDDAYREQLKAINVEHLLIPTSIVNHVDNGSNTLKTVDSETNYQLTMAQAKVFNKKFNANKFNLNKSS
jgi:GT2 family glycosyltransferase